MLRKKSQKSLKKAVSMGNMKKKQPGREIEELKDKERQLKERIAKKNREKLINS